MMNPQDIIGQYQQYLMPWYNKGLGDFNTYSDLANQMASNPVDWYNQVMGQYQMSPAAQEQSQYLNQQVQNAAAKGGYVGTPQEQMDMGNQLQRLIGQDQQQYYQDVMEPTQMGMKGLQYGSGLGFGATKQLGDMFSNEAMLQAAQDAQHQGLMGNMMGMGMGGLSKLLPMMGMGGAGGMSMLPALIPAGI